MNISEAILAATGGPSVPEGLRDWYIANGAVAGSLPDLEGQFLRANGVDGVSTRDMWVSYLEGIGYSGSLNDMLYNFWVDGGGGVLPDITSILAGDSYDAGVLFGYSQGGESGIAGSKLPINGAIGGYEVYTLMTFDLGEGLSMYLILTGEAPQSVFNTLTVDGVTYASADATYIVDDYNPLEPFTRFSWSCLSPLVVDTSYTVTYT